jgi:hypothetical protein
MKRALIADQRKLRLEVDEALRVLNMQYPRLLLRIMKSCGYYESRLR